MHKDENLSTNLLAASLFGVAYGVDAQRGAYHTVVELHRFCSLALQANGIDAESLMSESEADRVEHGAAVARTQHIMGSIESDAECIEFTRGDALDMLALGLANVVNLQPALSEEEREWLMEALGAMATSSSEASRTH